MTKSEHKHIADWASTLSNDQLEQEYFAAVYKTLGSEADIMEEQGWEEIDIRERRKFEKWLLENANLIEMLCEERGIKLWRETK